MCTAVLYGDRKVVGTGSNLIFDKNNFFNLKKEAGGPVSAGPDIRPNWYRYLSGASLVVFVRYCWLLAPHLFHQVFGRVFEHGDPARLAVRNDGSSKLLISANNRK